MPRDAAVERPRDPRPRQAAAGRLRGSPGRWRRGELAAHVHLVRGVVERIERAIGSSSIRSPGSNGTTARAALGSSARARPRGAGPRPWSARVARAEEVECTSGPLSGAAPDRDTRRLWNTASSYAERSRIDGLITRMSGPIISPAAMPITCLPAAAFPRRPRVHRDPPTGDRPHVEDGKHLRLRVVPEVIAERPLEPAHSGGTVPSRMNSALAGTSSEIAARTKRVGAPAQSPRRSSSMSSGSGRIAAQHRDGSPPSTTAASSGWPSRSASKWCPVHPSCSASACRWS